MAINKTNTIVGIRSGDVVETEKGFIGTVTYIQRLSLNGYSYTIELLDGTHRTIEARQFEIINVWEYNGETEYAATPTTANKDVKPMAAKTVKLSEPMKVALRTIAAHYDTWGDRPFTVANGTYNRNWGRDKGVACGNVWIEREATVDAIAGRGFLNREKIDTGNKYSRFVYGWRLTAIGVEAIRRYGIYDLPEQFEERAELAAALHYPIGNYETGKSVTFVRDEGLEARDFANEIEHSYREITGNYVWESPSRKLENEIDKCIRWSGVTPTERAIVERAQQMKRDEREQNAMNLDTDNEIHAAPANVEPAQTDSTVADITPADYAAVEAMGETEANVFADDEHEPVVTLTPMTCDYCERRPRVEDSQYCEICNREIVQFFAQTLIDDEPPQTMDKRAASDEISKQDAAKSDDVDGDEHAFTCTCGAYYVERTGELCGDCVGKLRAEIARLTRERDAAVAALEVVNKALTDATWTLNSIANTTDDKSTSGQAARGSEKLKQARAEIAKIMEAELAQQSGAVEG